MIHMRDTHPRGQRGPSTIQFYEPDDPEMLERLNLLAVKYKMKYGGKVSVAAIAREALDYLLRLPDAESILGLDDSKKAKDGKRNAA